AAFGLLAVLLLPALPGPAVAQEPASDSARLAAAQKQFDAGHWEPAARLAQGPANQSVDLDFVAGLALAKLQPEEAGRAASATGHRKAPTQARFLVEMAGVEYKRKDFAAAKAALRAALQLDPRDNYTRDFLGTLYFLDGNLEAALHYWNPLEKPRL